jgi:hypothetical protein
MTYGLRIINDEDELLIDSEYFSPTFVQKLEFSTTATATEASTGQLHPGYVRRTYTTPAVTAPGNYIVMWTIPDNGSSDVWYSFETSTTTIMGVLTCYVYANSTGTALSYTLPTAYLFTVDTLPETTGPALRMYNSATPQKKTFDSNNVQLAPYSISDTFAFSISGANASVYGAIPVSINILIPSNPIFMVPDFNALRITSLTNPVRHEERVYESAFKRVGTSLSTRLFISYYAMEDYAWGVGDFTYKAGKTQDISVIVADANLYEAAGGGTGTGTNPTYILSSSASSTNEGTSITITLNTTYVADTTKIYYTVTGIAAADLSVGGVSGYFSISNNTATANFTFTNDALTEGTEVFQLSLDGLTQYVDVSVLDTSRTPTYSWSTPNNVNEGSQGYTVFNATDANGKVVTFSIVGPSTGVTITGADGSLDTGTWTVSGNAATSINVYYTATADLTTEGPEKFRINALVDGVTYTSSDITVNDTSLTPVIGYSVTAADTWNESSTNTVTISATNTSGTVLYLTTDNSLVTPAISTVTVVGTNYSTNVNYTVGIFTTNTSVTLQVRTGSASGTIVASKIITVANVAASYSFGTVAALNEGSSGSVQFNYSYAANKPVTFSTAAPTSGANGSGSIDISLSTTSFTVGNTNSSGSTTVNYSALADTLTEGTEYFRIAATVDGSIYYSDNITINDTSLTPAPTYSLTRSVASVNEGGSFTITFSTNQTGSFGYTISGVSSADIGNASLTGTVSNGSVLSYSVTSDSTTEGTETFNISLNNGLASTSVTINDTSVTAPSYSLSNTFTGDLSNGGGFNFYHNAYNASGTAVTISKSGTGASYVTISPSSFTVSGSSENRLISVTSTTRSAGTAQQSVTISTSTGQSFSFTLAAVPATVPLVSSVTYASAQSTYYNGEALTAYINMSGPIIAGTYVRVAVWLNGSEAGYNVFTAGQTIAGVVGEFPIGTSSGYYTVTNPGLNGTVQIKAKAVTSGGVDRQAYINGPSRTLSSAAPP